jgi:hypothetical protein
MKSIKSIFFFLAGILFLVGCKTTSINEKLIIGNWKNGHINSFVANEKYASDTNFFAANQLRSGSNTPNQKALEQASLKEFKESFKTNTGFKPIDLLTLMKTGMDFNPDKSATLYTAKGNHGGTWKMNLKGDKVTVLDTLTKKKIIINIAKLDSAKLQICEKIPTGNLYVTFNK